MRVAFYGITRQVGTSANMAAVSAGLISYLQFPVFVEYSGKNKETLCGHTSIPSGAHVPCGKNKGIPCGHTSMPCGKNKGIILRECGRNEEIQKIINTCDLLVLNLSIPCQESEYIYFRHFFVHANVIFLIGKYHKNQADELKKLTVRCRIDPARICVMPYNLRFQKAYENQKILKYVKDYGKNAGSYEALVFEKYLRKTVNTIITCGNRKGENYYG